MYNKHMKLKKKQFLFYFLAILILGSFLYLYNYLNIHNSSDPLIFNSPDETANYYFSELFANTSQLKQESELLNITNEIHPRSINGINNHLVPNSFIGIFLIYGSLAKIFGNWIIIYLTPLISIMGVLFFYLLIKEIFDKKVAIISTFLLLILPSYWYFSTKVMMHNVLFMDLLIISLYFIVCGIKNNKLWHYLSSTLFLSLALLVRSSEIIWVTIIFLTLLIAFRKKINWQKISIGFLMLLIFAIPIIYFNIQNNGSATSVAYLENIGPETHSTLHYIKRIILPFGFHPRNMQFTIVNFIFKLIWWHSIALLVSLIFIFIKRKEIKPEHWLYLSLWGFVSMFLFTYYGSWLFFDNPDPTAITIGSSYLRYMLPYFVFGIPLIAWFLSKINFKKKWLNNLIIILILGLMSLGSYSIVMQCPQEGIIKISNDLKTYQNRTNLIIAHTETDSIIMTSRADKYIFPYRNVLYLKTEVYDYNNFSTFIEENYPLYYFGFKFRAEELDQALFNLYQKGLDLSDPIFIDGDHALYKIMPINKIYAKN
jgi:Dolichyl-phosphate-mannose-protein mannosyltransferase